MRATIIIAGHNEGLRLSNTVASCLETCGQLDHEIVVADDASTDDSVEAMSSRFPHVRLVRHPQRRGASPTKALGAREARGDVLVFLDGHCKPEYEAIRQLVEDVEATDGDAVVTPEIAALDSQRWTSACCQSGNGYYLKLDKFECGWLALSSLRKRQVGRSQFYESPALIGCALAVSRPLYDKLRGFDPHMYIWGSEDLDFGLKCWLLGHPILHDPRSVVGHRFRASFDNYAVPVEHVVANQLRMARKNLGRAAWHDWLDRCRQRNQVRLTDHPEGLWARVWEIFEADRPSVEQERSYLHAHRVHDEFWFAERFGLTWPKLASPGSIAPAPTRKPADQSSAAGSSHYEALAEPSPSPSPSQTPKKQCRLDSVTVDTKTGCANSSVTFTAVGENTETVQWTAIGATKTQGTGKVFTTSWASNGKKTVQAQCPTGKSVATDVSIVKIDLSFNRAELRPGCAPQRAEKVTVSAKRSGGGGDVAIDVALDDKRATVNPTSFTLPAGQDSIDQVVTVQGVTISGDDKDTKLTASVKDCPDQKADIPVTVVQPENWTCTGLGGPMNNNNPVIGNPLQDGSVWIQWNFNVTFTFLDRFSQPLGEQWSNAPAALAYESIGGNISGFDRTKPFDGSPLDRHAQAVDPILFAVRAKSSSDAQKILQKKTPCPVSEIVSAIMFVLDDAGTSRRLKMSMVRRIKSNEAGGATMWQSKVP
jgi:GT2 family glycosyltransferase